MCSTLLKGNSVPVLFAILLHERFVSFALVIHLFLPVWTHGYLFYTQGYNPVLLHFVAALATGSSFRLAPVLLSRMYFYSVFCC